MTFPVLTPVICMRLLQTEGVHSRMMYSSSEVSRQSFAAHNRDSCRSVHPTLPPFCLFESEGVQSGGRLVDAGACKAGRPFRHDIPRYADIGVFACAVEWHTMKMILQHEGRQALFAGAKARVLFHIPAAAVQWCTYETMKSLLLKDR